MAILSHNRDIGNKGEDIASRFLMKRGFEVIQRNFLRKCGEIDLIAKKDGVYRFVEVKTVEREIVLTPGAPEREEKDGYRPEDNVHPWKMQRLGRVIQMYLLEKNVSDEIDWQIDLVTVYLDLGKNVARVKLLENIVL